MTGEEMERAIEFLLQSQARLEQRIEQVNHNLGERIAELSNTVQMLAASQSQFNQTMTATITALAESQQKLAESHERLADSLRHTDRKLDALIDIVRERFERKDGS